MSTYPHISDSAFEFHLITGNQNGMIVFVIHGTCFLCIDLFYELGHTWQAIRKRLALKKPTKDAIMPMIDCCEHLFFMFMLYTVVLRMIPVDSRIIEAGLIKNQLLSCRQYYDSKCNLPLLSVTTQHD